MDDPDKAVFLSYASQDADAARRICEALRAAGVEVWFDQSELRGGEAWDTSIRRQIKTCALFLPIISTNTTARTEGYFRLEWKLAVDRSHLMASNKAFLLPIVIDDMKSAAANVPDRFREMQWIRLPGGEPTATFVERVALLIAHHGSHDAAPDNSTQTVAGTSPPSSSVSRRSQAMQRRTLWLAAALGVLLIGAAWAVRHRLAEPARVVPYSAEDRRMTFALLPLQATDEDPIEAQIAKATGAQAFAWLDLNHNWVNLAPQASVARALERTAVPQELAKILNVHFLISGRVSRAPSGHLVRLSTVDGETERTLGSFDISIPPNSLTPRWDDEMDDATGSLVYYGLQVEGARARGKADADLDVRDLSYRAWLDWGPQRKALGEKTAYTTTNALLNRALNLAPDDSLALWMTAQLNLCDCVGAWSNNVAEQQALGEAALDRYLDLHPDNAGMLRRKADLYQLRGHYQESLDVLDNVLRRNPSYYEAREDKVFALLKLGRIQEAAALAASISERHPDDWPSNSALLAAIDFMQRDYTGAERLARRSTTQMDKADLSNPRFGAVRLTLIAAAAQLHDTSTATSALADLRESVPQLTTISSIRKWMHPQADLYGYEPLFDGLRLAGLHD